MDTWIISESDEITARIRKSLRKLDIECPISHVISAESIGQTVLNSVGTATIVFYAASGISVEQTSVLRQFRSAGQIKLVMVAPVSEPAVILKAIRAGASDFLNSDCNVDEELADVVERFKAESIQRSSKGRLISVVPCQIPSDASILAVNIAATLARSGAGCALLDFQLRGGDLAMLLKLSPRHTLYDLITQRECVDDTMFRQALTNHESGVQLLAGPPLFSDFASMQTHACQHILGLAQALHPFVVINSEDILHAEQVRTLASSDEIVLTMRLDLVSLYRTQQHLAFLRRDLPSSDRIHVVAMSTGHHGELPAQSVKKVLGVEELHCIPDDPVTTTMSINVGNPMILESPHAKISHAIVKLTRLLSGATALKDQDTDRSTASGLRAAALLTLNVLPFCK